MLTFTFEQLLSETLLYMVTIGYVIMLLRLKRMCRGFTEPMKFSSIYPCYEFVLVESVLVVLVRQAFRLIAEEIVFMEDTVAYTLGGSFCFLLIGHILPL